MYGNVWIVSKTKGSSSVALVPVALVAVALVPLDESTCANTSGIDNTKASAEIIAISVRMINHDL